MLNNSESFDLWFLKKENQISKDGIYIKKVITTKDFFDVMKLRKERYLYQDDENIFLVKKKDEVLATISYIQNERNFTITTFESKDENIDPVGSCVGQKGVRIQNIINELNGEKIDVIEWNSQLSM